MQVELHLYMYNSTSHNNLLMINIFLSNSCVLLNQVNNFLSFIFQTKRNGSYVSRMEYKKISKLITSLEDVFKKLVETFEVCPEIRQILILLGGTVLSPKELYLITFPPYHPESNNVSSKFCVRYFLRELICQDLVGKLKDIRVTNAIIMVKAPQDSGITWFLPKPNFTVPVRGEQFSFNLISKPNSEVFNHDLTYDEHEVEISGIEPFDASSFDLSVEEHMMKMFNLNEFDNSVTNQHDKHPVLASVEKARKLSVNTNISSILDEDILLQKIKDDKAVTNKESDGMDEELSVGEKSLSVDRTDNSWSSDDTILQKTIDSNKSLYDVDCIWFQAPFIIKGYKDKTSTKSTGLL